MQVEKSDKVGPVRQFEQGVREAGLTYRGYKVRVGEGIGEWGLGLGLGG
jgi:hypothetical protein